MKKLITILLLSTFLSSAYSSSQEDYVKYDKGRHKLEEQIMSYSKMTVTKDPNRKYANATLMNGKGCLVITKRFVRIQDLETNSYVKYRVTGVMRSPESVLIFSKSIKDEERIWLLDTKIKDKVACLYEDETVLIKFHITEGFTTNLSFLD